MYIRSVRCTEVMQHPYHSSRCGPGIRQSLNMSLSLCTFLSFPKQYLTNHLTGQFTDMATSILLTHKKHLIRATRQLFTLTTSNWLETLQKSNKKEEWLIWIKHCTYTAQFLDIHYIYDNQYWINTRILST